MNQITHNTITNVIRGIADDVLRDHYKHGKYQDLILPMTVIRRIDALLEETDADPPQIAGNIAEGLKEVIE